jgi:hypothetical protein
MPMYQISFKVNGNYFNSDIFYSQSEVDDIYQTLIKSEFNEEVVITELATRRTYYGFIDEALSDAAAEDECEDEWVDLSGRQFNKYGKGYMLYPLGKKDIYYGEKYLMNGWWNKTDKGWFFKKEFYDELIEHNAKPTGWENLISGVETPKTQETEDEWIDLTGRKFKEYGKGYMLYPTGKKDIYYGEKYFMNGWWNDLVKGWFFKREFYTDLIEYGAELDIVKKSKVKSTHSKGWTETDTTQIKKEIIDEEEEDSDYVPEDVQDEPAEEFESDEVDTDMSNMVFMKYGKGYILKTHKKDSRYGASYFMDGFWNDKAKGWFFKKEFKKTMKKNGATYLKLAK